MPKAHFISQLNFHTQLPISCDTVLISYAPTHLISLKIANSIQQLQGIIKMYASHSQCVILCSEHKRQQIKYSFKEYLEEKEQRQKQDKKQRNQDDQLMEDLSESNGQVGQNLQLKLKQIIERTQKKVRESKIMMKMDEIDLSIKKIEDLQTKSNLKKTIDSISGKNNGINKLGKKERKKQKGAKKKMEKLQDKKESTNNGKQSFGALEQLLEQKSSSSDSILV